MIVTTIRLQTTPENRKEILQTFRSLSDPIQSERGCKSCRIYRELGNDAAVIVIQEWDCKDHWNQHLRSDEFAVIIGALSLLQKPGTVEFQVLDQLEGSRSVEEIKARNFKKQGDLYEFPKSEQDPRKDEIGASAETGQHGARGLGTANKRGAAT